MPQRGPSAEQIQSALDEVLGWQAISRSPQLSDLLKYVVGKTLAGDEGSIKAYSIAVDVFGRPQSFDPQADPIVRVQARRLRSLLDQFYATGQSQSGVQIRLPLGRYVPEFIPLQSVDFPAAPAAPTPAAPLLPAPVASPPSRLARLLLPGLLGVCFTLIGVALAVVIVRSIPTTGQPSVVMPDEPRIAVGTFDNLTGETGMDVPVGQLTTQVNDSLELFDDIVVNGGGEALQLSGGVQRDGSALELRSTLTRPGNGGIVWSTTIEPRDRSSDGAMLASLSQQLVRQLTSARGPLHGAGRNWLAQQTQLPPNPTDYVCRLAFYAWRDHRTSDTALSAIACFQQLLDRDPRDATAIAGSASAAAWQAQVTAGPGDQMVALLLKQQTAADLAVKLLPDNSFVHEQQALVAARAGSYEDAIGAVNEALRLNPNNTDAIASKALFVALSGSWAEGAALAQEAVDSAPSPPPWYYILPAFSALREGRYLDAADAGQALAAGDDELGPVAVLAAAPLIGRADLIDRYKPMVLGNPTFQNVGILPRLAVYLRQQALVDRIHDGLIQAGIPEGALTAPFNPDGSPKG